MPSPSSHEPTPGASVEGRRKALAEWVASPANPLTARVMANRVWAWHFGTPLAGNPDNGVRVGTAFGRDHNPKAMTVWLAGGGVKAGHTVGKTDETGGEAIDYVRHVRDLHVTLLHLLGLDDNKLTFYHGGRFKRLSQFGGQVIKDLLA